MPFLEEDFNFGRFDKEKVPERLLRAMDDAYNQTAFNVNRKPDVVLIDRAPAGTPDANNNIPSTTDLNFRDSTIWIKQDGAVGPITAEVYIKAETIVSGGNKTALWVKLN